MSRWRSIASIYRFEMARFARTFWTSIILPVITTSLYFIVFGSAIGGQMATVGGVPYGAFIVPGLMMLSMFTEGISNASFGIYLPKWSGTIYEVLSAPISPGDMATAYVGAAATKSVIVGLLIFATAHLFVAVEVAYPLLMLAFMLAIAVAFCLFGMIIGIWAKSFEQLQVVPFLIVYPLTFLGGAFYSIDMLPPAWRTVTLFNPVVYIISAFRWTFFGTGEIPVLASMGAVAVFLLVCLAIVLRMLHTGYRIRT